MGRSRLEHQIDESGVGVAFDVELGADRGHQIVDILIADVALIGTWVHGDAVGTKVLNAACSLYHIGHICATGIAQGGDFVDVDAEQGAVV